METKVDLKDNFAKFRRKFKKKVNARRFIKLRPSQKTISDYFFLLGLQRDIKGLQSKVQELNDSRVLAECPICYRHINGQMLSTPCGHIYCHPCLQIALHEPRQFVHSWARNSPKCPTCRKSVRLNQCHRIYLN